MLSKDQREELIQIGYELEELSGRLTMLVLDDEEEKLRSVSIVETKFAGRFARQYESGPPAGPEAFPRQPSATDKGKAAS